MAIEKILVYQAKDLEVYRMEKDFSQAREVEQLYKCQNLFKEKRDILLKLGKELEELFSQLDRFDERMGELEKKKTDIDVNVNSLDEGEEFEKFEFKVSEFEDTVGALNRDANRIMKRIGEIGAESKKVNEQMDVLNMEYAKNNQMLEMKKKELLIKIAPVMKQLTAMAAEVPEELLKRYKKLRAEKKMPAFVPYNEGNCFACGMDISIEVDAKLSKAGDFTECPHCRRFVYKA